MPSASIITTTSGWGSTSCFVGVLWSQYTPHSARSSSNTDLEDVLKSSLRWKIDECVTEDIHNRKSEVEARRRREDRYPEKQRIPAWYTTDYFRTPARLVKVPN